MISPKSASARRMPSSVLPTAVGPTGPSGTVGIASGSAAGNTPYWNGSSWVVTSGNLYNNGGNVGIAFAIPADEVQRIATQLRTTGRVIRSSP